ncbi:MAG: DUF1559 domain-containing protein [Planctomycetaceae bacterium]|nr:DUF1559 domain-containing protein [Planctomycetaceae bacterium]
MSLAVANYHEVYDSFPPAVVYAKDGTPMHSWRVLILPFINEGELYDRYNFEEPWDSVANRRLISECPNVFHMHDEQNEQDEITNYLAVTGEDTLWPPQGTAGYDSIPDGSGRTILIVENRQGGVIWSEPRDLHINTMTLTPGTDPVNGISSWKNPPAVVFADGSLHRLDASITASDVRALLQRSDAQGDPQIAPQMEDGRDRPAAPILPDPE